MCTEINLHTAKELVRCQWLVRATAMLNLKMPHACRAFEQRQSRAGISPVSVNHMPGPAEEQEAAHSSLVYESCIHCLLYVQAVI